MWIIDLRSDTFTKPSAEMRRFMSEAPVGDDVFDEDPTIHELQNETAELLGKEAALYCTSGCMSNQLALAVNTHPADEVIVEAESHIFHYETTAASYLSRVQLYPVVTKDKGLLSVEEVEEARRDPAYYMPVTRILCVENTVNKAGGRVYSLQRVKELTDYAKKLNIITHLDGARLWNACAANGSSLKDYAQHFDTVSLCYSKGLGAPVGSAFCGTKEMVDRARRFRKIWGGGMRQAGVIAAGALYALRNNRDRIVEDNMKAQRFAHIITNETTRIRLSTSVVESNIVLLDLPEGYELSISLADLTERGVRLSSMGPRVLRAITHMDVSMNDCEKAAKIVAEYFAK